MKSALDHAARDIGNHSTDTSQFARASRHVGHWLLSGSNPIKICCNLAGGVGATKNDELIVEASVCMWSVETICADLPGAIRPVYTTRLNRLKAALGRQIV